MRKIFNVLKNHKKRLLKEISAQVDKLPWHEIGRRCGRSADYCCKLYYWRNCKRGAWTLQEDLTLKQLYKQFPNQWSELGIRMNRTGKQCRDRYVYHLQDNLNKDAFTRNEDVMLLRLHSMKLKWSQMAKYFNKRSTLMLKNRYNLIKD